MQFLPRKPFAMLAGLLMALSAPASIAHAQATGTIRGTVTDSTTQRGVPGVQVSIAGTTRGAVTNDDGVYTLTAVPAGTATVRAQRIGYASQSRDVRVVAGDAVTADFALHPVATVLSTVVSVGYGTASRQDVSSAIASVDSTAFANTPVAGVDNALQGRIPGVQVMQNSGEPGSGISIRVRGPASLNAGNAPLYVVDGVPMIQGSLSQIALSGQDVTAITGLNPDEIASIDVLKDAAAAAIYGSRGSNGVVIVTTKRGAAGKTRFSLNSYLGTQKVEKTIGLLNAQQYVEVMNESAKNDGYAPDDYDFTPGVDDAATYDWQGAVFRRAPVSDVNLSLNGGSDRLRYYLSGSNFDQRGIVIGSGYTRQAGRLNLDINATDKFFVSSSIGLTREDNDRIPGDQSLDGVVTNAIGMQPMRPIYGSSYGYAGDNEDLRYSNPVAIADFNFDKYKTLRALGTVSARYLISNRFSLDGRVGADVYGIDELTWSDPKVDGTYAASANGVGRTASNTNTKYVAESYLTVDALNSASNRLNLIGGASVEYNHRDLSFTRGEGFPSGFSTYIANAATITSWDGSATDNNLVSFFSRANWSYKDRYLLSASLRADGSSRFGADNRYGIFPAVSAGWNVTDEGFAQGLANLATLKLRASYGVTGNQGIGDFASRSLASGSPYSGEAGVAPTQLGNPSLKWETTREVDLGADVSMLDDRASLIVDWYNRNTSNLLVRRPIPSTSGYTSIWSNIGAIRNRGVDLGLHTVNLDGGARGLGWSSDLNVTWNRNVVTDLYGDQNATFTVSSRVTSVVAVGQPIGEFYLYKFVGVTPDSGNARFESARGTIVPADSLTADDLMFVGSPQPKYYGGFTNTFTFRDFDLRGFLQFSQGTKVFNMMRIFTDDGGWSYDNKTTHVLNRWQKPGDITNEPRMSYDGVSGARVISSRFVEDGSFVRLGELTLGYKLPDRLASAASMSNARIYLSGRNLHTWTSYSGYNPDVNSAGIGSNVVMGVDYYAYPLARTFTLGVSASWRAGPPRATSSNEATANHATQSSNSHSPGAAGRGGL
jgi:TonB-linked SusC/RagA family outer membrane protein